MTLDFNCAGSDVPITTFLSRSSATYRHLHDTHRPPSDKFVTDTDSHRVHGILLNEGATEIRRGCLIQFVSSVLVRREVGVGVRSLPCGGLAEPSSPHPPFEKPFEKKGKERDNNANEQKDKTNKYHPTTTTTTTTTTWQHTFFQAIQFIRVSRSSGMVACDK